MHTTSTTGLDGRRALNPSDVANLVGYKRDTIYRLTRSGRFPAPIDADRPTRSWRWSPRIVDDYIDGTWTEAAA